MVDLRKLLGLSSHRLVDMHQASHSAGVLPLGEGVHFGHGAVAAACLQNAVIDAGIHPGDIVLVERGATPRNNDIVVAQVDDEWTLKYYVSDRKGVRLEAANRRFQTIVPKRSMTIGGVVRTVIRKYP